MGISYMVIPIGEIDEEGIEWLQTSIGLEVPEWTGVSRYPNADEVRAVAAELKDYQVSFSGGGKSLDVHLQHREIPSRHATIWLKDGEVDEKGETGRNLYFHRGHPETVVEVTERLARICGPLFVSCQGEDWLLVSEGTPPDAPWT